MSNEVASVQQRIALVKAIRADFPAGCEGCPELAQCYEVVEANVSFPTSNRLLAAELALAQAVTIATACEQGSPNKRSILGFTAVSCASPAAK